MEKRKPQIGRKVRIGKNVQIHHQVKIGDGCRIESGSVLYDGVELGAGSYVGPNVVLGERLRSYYEKPQKYRPPKCRIGSHSLLRAGTIIYGGVTIGPYFETGPYVTIREKTTIGAHSRFGNFSDVQGACRIGNYVSAHSNVTIGQFSKVEDYVWLHPYVILLNDWYPPTALGLKGPTVGKYSVVGAGAVLFPGVRLGEHAVVGAHANVKKDVKSYQLITNENSASPVDCRKIMTTLKGQIVRPYPWMHHRQEGYPRQKTKRRKRSRP